jgi:hypothetical protein
MLFRFLIALWGFVFIGALTFSNTPQAYNASRMG